MPAVRYRHAAAVPRAERLECRLLCTSQATEPPEGFAATPENPHLFQLVAGGEIAPVGDVDFFRLGRLHQADVVTIAQSAGGSVRGTLWDSEVALFRVGANPEVPLQVAIDNDGGSGDDSLILRFSIPADDVYLVRARAGDVRRTGTYELSAWLETGGAAPALASDPGLPTEAEPNDSAATAIDLSAAWRAVPFVSSSTGALGSTAATGVTEQPYALRAGDVVTVVVDSTSTLDAAVSLVDPNSDAVLAADRGDSNRRAGDVRDAYVFACHIPRTGTYVVRVAANSGTAGAYRADVYLSRDETTVVGHHLFYNNSSYDGRSPATGSADDDAIAPDKTALLPGGQATAANFTSYAAGINGVMVDVKALPADLTAGDFDFAMSRGAAPVEWVAAPQPALISRRAGAGDGGSNRVTLTWPDGAIVDRWLRITLKSSIDNGLAADDVFSFGNLVGETGDDPTEALVTPADAARTRAARSAACGLTDPFDFNRDGRVNSLDQAIARSRAFHTLPLSDPTFSAMASASAAERTANRRAAYRPWDDLLH